MIGGYIFQHEEPAIASRLNAVLDKTYHRVPCGEAGFLFYDEPFSDAGTSVYTSNQLTLLSQDLLITSNSDGEHAFLSLSQDLPDMFLHTSYIRCRCPGLWRQRPI